MGVGEGGETYIGLGILFIYGRSWRSLMVCQFSSLHLWNNMEFAYCVEIMLICLNIFFDCRDRECERCFQFFH